MRIFKGHLYMGKNLSLFLMFSGSLVLGLFSCGDNLNPKKKTSYESSAGTSLFQEGQCKENKVPSPTILEAKVIQLFEKATEFTYQYNRSHYPYVQAPGQILNLNLLKSTPLNPLILNEGNMKMELEVLNQRWNQALSSENEIFTKDNIIMANYIPIQIERLEVVNEVHQLISTLKEKVKRFNAQACNLEELTRRKDKDVRPMYLFNAAMEGHGSLESKEVENRLLAMCESYNTKSLCLTELLINKRKKNLQPIKDHYHKLFKEREKGFFEHQSKLKFTCLKEEEKTLVLLPIERNEDLRIKLFGSYQALKDTVEEKWNNDKIRVVLNIVEPNQGGIQIKWGDSSLSYVDMNNPKEITLSKGLNFSNLLITLSHEIGHVFGFNDCYHEFYDTGSKSIVYYSLDSSGQNLMCNLSFNSRIPDQYLETLIQNSCD